MPCGQICTIWQDLSETFLFLLKCWFHWIVENAQPYQQLRPSNSCNFTDRKSGKYSTTTETWQKEHATGKFPASTCPSGLLDLFPWENCPLKSKFNFFERTLLGITFSNWSGGTRRPDCTSSGTHKKAHRSAKRLYLHRYGHLRITPQRKINAQIHPRISLLYLRPKSSNHVTWRRQNAPGESGKDRNTQSLVFSTSIFGVDSEL